MSERERKGERTYSYFAGGSATGPNHDRVARSLADDELTDELEHVDERWPDDPEIRADFADALRREIKRRRGR